MRRSLMGRGEGKGRQRRRKDMQDVHLFVQDVRDPGPENHGRLTGRAVYVNISELV